VDVLEAVTQELAEFKAPTNGVAAKPDEASTSATAEKSAVPAAPDSMADRASIKT